VYKAEYLTVVRPDRLAMPKDAGDSSGERPEATTMTSFSSKPQQPSPAQTDASAFVKKLATRSREELELGLIDLLEQLQRKYENETRSN
jgi:hypothetical protein